MLAALLLTLAVMPVAAQDETPEPGPAAAGFLPEASIFGDGWAQSQVVSPDILARYSFTMSPDVFREGAAGIYLGPGGSRAIVVTLLLTDNRVAIRKSWEDATDLLQSMSYSVSTDYERDGQLETMEPPTPCVEAKRVEGTEQHYLVPYGATMCAVDPDIVAIVAVSGDALDAAGVAASDAIVGLAFGQ
jgi:hypothetical protein